MTFQHDATNLLLALLPVAALPGCTDTENDQSTGHCIGAKCDDVAPADFACKDLRDQSGRGSANVLEALHDPFAELALKRGSGCPVTFDDVMARLRETDTDDCVEMVTHLVSESEAQAPDGVFRSATSRGCNGLRDFSLVFSLFGLTESRIPSAVEVMAFDAETQEFNFYAAENNSITFFGSSRDILAGTAGRCKDCHTGGGLVMKELRNPWQNWEGFNTTSRALIDEHEDDLNDVGFGASMEFLTTTGNSAWNATKLAILADPSGGFEVRDLLRPLFCGDEFNLDTGGTSGGGSFRELPLGFFAHCKLLGANCNDTHFGESGGVPIDNATYVAATSAAGQIYPGPDTLDTHFAMVFVEPAMADIDFIEKAITAGILDEDFVLDVLSIDFTRPVFSESRCGLLDFAPQWGDLQASPDPLAGTTVESLRDTFVAKLVAGGVAASDATPAGELLKALSDREDGPRHRERATAFLQACKGRDARALMDDALAYLTIQRKTANGHHVMEPSVSAKVPNTNLDPAASVHFDPATCDLIE